MTEAWEIRLAALVLAIAPSALLLFFVQSRLGGRTSWELISIGLIAGGILGIPAGTLQLLIQPLLDDPALPAWVTRAFYSLMAGVTEEGVKLTAFLLLILRHAECRRPADICVGAVAVSVGFATLENVLYVFHRDVWHHVAALRAMMAVPGHLIFGVLLGTAAAWGRTIGRPGQGIAIGFLVAALAHALYNYPLMLLEHEGASIGRGAVLMLLLLFLAALTGKILACWRCLGLVERMPCTAPPPRPDCPWLYALGRSRLFWAVATIAYVSTYVIGGSVMMIADGQGAVALIGVWPGLLMAGMMLVLLVLKKPPVDSSPPEAALRDPIPLAPAPALGDTLAPAPVRQNDIPPASPSAVARST